MSSSSPPPEERERLQSELALLDAMYPSQITYSPHVRELSFRDATTGTLQIHLPEKYLVSALPEIVEATASVSTHDLREALRARVRAECSPGEEVLDAVIVAFLELVSSAAASSAPFKADPSSGDVQGNSDQTGTHPANNNDDDSKSAKATVVIWLHHLLNTGKRKQATSPASADVAGVTKPGSPGVMVFAGPRAAVRAHVEGLKALKWQAFQVRLESEVEWEFGHGKGVREVGSMGEVVAELGEEVKGEFLEAMRIK